jgi:CspA family cold shock protein
MDNKVYKPVFTISHRVKGIKKGRVSYYRSYDFLEFFYFFVLFVKKKLRSIRRNKKMKGTVKWYNTRKGYGFINTEDDKDIFVHKSAIPAGTFLNEGDKVDFETEESERGLNAKNVKKI